MIAEPAAMLRKHYQEELSSTAWAKTVRDDPEDIPAEFYEDPAGSCRKKLKYVKDMYTKYARCWTKD